jgi:hypothetical protein
MTDTEHTDGFQFISILPLELKMCPNGHYKLRHGADLTIYYDQTNCIMVGATGFKKLILTN